MAESRRSRRVGASLRAVLGEMVTHELKDPRLSDGVVTITEVEVTPDLGLATVYVATTFDAPEDLTKLLQGFESAKPFLRSETARRLKLRKVPELRFRLDSSGREGRQIEAILAEITAKGGPA